MASVQHSITPPQYVPKVETHERMLPQDVRKCSNYIRSGAKSYYEYINVEEHGHVLVSISVPKRKTRKQMLHEHREMLGNYLNAQRVQILISPNKTSTLFKNNFTVNSRHSAKKTASYYSSTNEKLRKSKFKILRIHVLTNETRKNVDIKISIHFRHQKFILNFST